MGIEVLTGALFKEMVKLAANNLANYRERINELNVFPVPDGDTGTNMELSFSSGIKAIAEEKSDDLQQVLRVFMRGLLMGARGNSGVILSQLFRGFTQYIETEDEVTSETFAQALKNGVLTAYSTVTNPVEGTILTVAKDAAETAEKVAKTEKNICTVMEHVVETARQSLQRTPELLPILKEVGVIDSGGKGLLVIYEGFLAALRGERGFDVVQTEISESLASKKVEQRVQSYIRPEEITYGYCTEFMIELDKNKYKPFSEDAFREKLSTFGDSLLIARDRDIVKVHVHTEQPGGAMTYAQQFGELMNIDIENMRKQHQQIVGEQHVSLQEATKYDIITVAAGTGLKKLFKSLGANYILSGGQTMNPSTEDFLEIIEQINAEHIILLPNNKNIILAAEQTKSLTDKNVTVIPTKTIPQGINALFHFDEELSVDENRENMLASIADVKTGLITYATRDTTLNGIEITKGSFIGLNDETIVTACSDKVETIKNLLTKIIDEDDEIVTIFYGEDVADEQIRQVERFFEKTFDDIELEIHHGDQPIYSFIVMIE